MHDIRCDCSCQPARSTPLLAQACLSIAPAATLLRPAHSHMNHVHSTRASLPALFVAGAPFNIMSRRVLGTNAHLAEAAAAILAQCPDAPGEPPALPLP